MIKKILFYILLLLSVNMTYADYSSEERKINRCTLNNGIDVISHEDFRMPIAVVGIIFDAGYFDASVDKSGIIDVIEEVLINKKMYMQLQELGVSYVVNVFSRYTEINASVNPKHLKKFFSIICENISTISVDNLEVLKKQIVINNKLVHCCFENAISDVISANIRLKNCHANKIFNEQSLRSICEKDVSEFFNKNYKKCHISVIVSGAVGYKNLIKVLQSTISNLEHRDAISLKFFDSDIPKEVQIESKYIGNSLRYFYKIPYKESANNNAVFNVFNYEVFKYFQKAHPIISGYNNNEYVNYGDNIIEITLYPKKDVSLNELQEAYEIFIHRMCKKDFSFELLTQITRINSYSNLFMLNNLQEVYFKIRNTHLSGRILDDIFAIEKNIQGINAKTIKAFIEKKLILKIITQYKSDK